MIFDEPWRGVGIQMFNDAAVANINLFAFDFRRYRNDNSEVFYIAFEVISHGDYRTIVVSDENDLRGLVEDTRISTSDVKSAKCLSRSRQRNGDRCGSKGCDYSHWYAPLIWLVFWSAVWFHL